ncbi:MAG: MBOAT family protein, partial [Deltaproteobacteria bacterium]|nr:MBOAT family protein [Deltaproteobacteria bacterium]
MLFNTTEFFLFFALIYIVYLLATHKLQNVILLAGSYFFYGYWDYRFLGLIVVSTLVDFVAAQR